MSFMDTVIADSMPLWEDAANETFLREMGEGTLDRSRMRDYIVQDSIYLRDYLKAFAMAIYKSRTLREMQLFYSVLGYVNDSENATRLRYLADFGLTDTDVEHMTKRPACEAYTSFLLDTAEREELPEILMSVMPCMLGYRYVFDVLRERCPEVMNGYFAPLAADYTSQGYAQSCAEWTTVCEDICAPLDDQRKKKLTEIFREASRHELYFWRMAGEKA